MNEQTLAEIIKEKNEKRTIEYKQQAKRVVEEILDCQEVIVKRQMRIVELKTELKSLEEPTPLKLEL